RRPESAPDSVDTVRPSGQPAPSPPFLVRPIGAIGPRMSASRTPPKTFHVKSFGCQMNVYDGERMAEMLGAKGLAPAAEGAEADLVVLNTCHIREKAAEKV